MKKSFPNFPLVICLLFLAPLLLTGCNKEGEAPKKSELVAKKVIPKANKIPGGKAASMKPADSGDAMKAKKAKPNDLAIEAGSNSSTVKRYNPEGRIDPFIPLFKEEQVSAATVKEKKKKRRTPLTPLEKVDLSQLRLLGVIMASSGNRAMVSEVNGKGYVVTVGTYIGIASGRVVEILKDRIIVEEEVENILGKKSLRKRELKLQKPAGEL